jgi:caffeoyl-CoA O-methyltransferase
MSPKSFLLDDGIAGYLAANNPPLSDVQASLIAATAELGGVAGMQIAPEQGAFMAFLVTLLGARNAVEVGTFTGYSALTVAEALGPQGHLLCCDVNEEWTSIGKRHWEMAGVADRIDLVLAPAAETLAALPADTEFDFAFIDADKGNYAVYYDAIVKRLAPNGMIVVDNVLWSGRIIDDTDQSDDTIALRAFNAYVANDPRTVSVMIPVSDGLTLIRRAD